MHGVKLACFFRRAMYRHVLLRWDCWQVLQQNWYKLITLQNAVRNVERVKNILCFAVYHLLWARDMWQPFDMINMMKFETEKGGGLYEMYRDMTGKLVMAKGGQMGFLADIKVHPIEANPYVLTGRQPWRLAFNRPGRSVFHDPSSSCPAWHS